MTESNTFSAAKLREYVLGRLGDNKELHPHSGLVEPGSTEEDLLTFIASLRPPRDGSELPPDLSASKAAVDLHRAAATSHVGSRIEDVPAYVSGLTDKEAEISSAKLFSKIQSSIVNNGAPYLCTMFGAPNAGKTSLAVLYIELWESLSEIKYPHTPDPVVLSNSSLPCVDHVVRDIDTFREMLFGCDGWFSSNGDIGTPPTIDPDTPTMWLFDEASTHLDARTHSREVAHQYTPLLKRFAKVNTDAIHIGHSGKDIHTELRRGTLMTEFIFKTDLKTATVYDRMQDDLGVDELYSLIEIPEPSSHVDPDDFAPWSWSSN